ncbi:MAG: response regulator [Acidobacteria bacterium]|nr:response regulator [Acidobacteriota bacterium]
MFDSHAAEWCDCTSATQTLACPMCGCCSCAAPADWKIRFGSLRFRQVADTLQPVVERRARGVDRRPLVLIVEDQAIVQRLALQALSEDYRVITAQDGLEGFKLATTHLPDVIVTDALMPKLDGRELCRNVKLFPATANTKVVIMTALYKSNRYESEALGAFKADAFLRKPFSAAELKETIRPLLAGHRLGQLSAQSIAS